MELPSAMVEKKEESMPKYNTCQYEHPDEMGDSITKEIPKQLVEKMEGKVRDDVSEDTTSGPVTAVIATPVSPNMSAKSMAISDTVSSTVGKPLNDGNKRIHTPLSSPSLPPSTGLTSITSNNNTNNTRNNNINNNNSNSSNTSNHNNASLKNENSEPISGGEFLRLIDTATNSEESSILPLSRHVIQHWNWDWNTLPKVGVSILKKGPNYNKILVEIDGKNKELHYDPSLNEHLSEMDMFLAFNSQTKPSDSLRNSKRRLTEYIHFVSEYLKVRKYAFECYPFNVTVASIIETELKEYVTYNNTNDYNEISMIIQLWYYQAQKFLLQSNSLLFSPDVVQHLLKRKVSSRKHQQQLLNQGLKEELNNISGSKSENTNTKNHKSCPHFLTSDIDILVLRPQLVLQIGWQLACDEPSLNIGDFPLDLSPWMHDEEDRKVISQTAATMPKESSYKLVTSEDELEVLDNDNAFEVLVDCMDRSYNLLQDQKKINQNDEVEKSTTTLNTEAEKTIEELPKLKKSQTKPTKKSGFVNFFKRKHLHDENADHLSPHLNATTPNISGKVKPKDITLGEPSISTPQKTPSSTSASSVTESGKIENNSSLLRKTTWLIDYYSNLMNNYKKVNLPTQFIIPNEVKQSVEDATTEMLPHQFMQRKPSNALLYGKEYLQLRLPFKSDSLPAIYCPWVWTELPHGKWKALLREIYRVVVPGGHVIAVAGDISMSNTFSIDDNEISESIYPTTTERDKTYDALSLEAINKGLHIHTTKHLSKAFKETGFTSIKSTILSLKTGDLNTEMGFLNELIAIVHWDHLMRKVFPDASNPPKDTDPPTLPSRYFEEHFDSVDDKAGCYRLVYLAAQKPKK
ncbi:Uncharacterized protein RNJ44_02173 [Nakaseomyces bracarensis]|uniref:Methyltransferase type 11 domain-containing protein n=1 Tax=Nakaseomyces bracarensis TaxID=273131 RepID=A0ABR4NMQ3_9SACH